ncbi:MAG: hypothetical protein ACFHVJ_16695 [Aestuariibacter sp.]
MFYILKDNNQVIEEPSLINWVKWKESTKSVILENRVEFEGSHVMVITEFTGSDQFKERGKPLLYETRSYGPDKSKEIIRTHDYESAVAAHKQCLSELQMNIEA